MSTAATPARTPAAPNIGVATGPAPPVRLSVPTGAAWVIALVCLGAVNCDENPAKPDDNAASSDDCAAAWFSHQHPLSSAATVIVFVSMKYIPHRRWRLWP